MFFKLNRVRLQFNKMIDMHGGNYVKIFHNNYCLLQPRILGGRYLLLLLFFIFFYWGEVFGVKKILEFCQIN